MRKQGRHRRRRRCGQRGIEKERTAAAREHVLHAQCKRSARGPAYLGGSGQQAVAEPIGQERLIFIPDGIRRQVGFERHRRRG